MQQRRFFIQLFSRIFPGLFPMCAVSIISNGREQFLSYMVYMAQSMQLKDKTIINKAIVLTTALVICLCRNLTIILHVFPEYFLGTCRATAKGLLSRFEPNQQAAGETQFAGCRDTLIRKRFFGRIQRASAKCARQDVMLYFVCHISF